MDDEFYKIRSYDLYLSKETLQAEVKDVEDAENIARFLSMCYGDVFRLYTLDETKFTSFAGGREIKEK